MIRKACALVSAISLLGVVVHSAVADIAPLPLAPKFDGNTVNVSIKVRNSDDGQTRLIIPKQFLVADAESPGEKQGMLEGPGGFRTVLAGVALSLAAVSVVLVRRKRNGARITAAGLLLAISCFAVGIATADIAVPGRERPPRPRRQPLPSVTIEYTDGGDVVELLRGKDFPK